MVLNQEKKYLGIYIYVIFILEMEKIKLEHCKTERMASDYFTKPLQGKLFKIIQNYIMGISGILIEERVGTNTKRSKNIAIGTQKVNGPKTYIQALIGKRMKDDVLKPIRGTV